ncbi:DNA dC-_dU-editing enzyme APOBEC-3A [Hipposideros larvatus]
MEAISATNTSPLMDEKTFLENFHHDSKLHQTYLCYEVERLEEDWITVEEYKGFLRNKPKINQFLPAQSANNVDPGRHAELCLLDQIPSWTLNESTQYRITCYISWSPCHDCAENLAAFLRENSHVQLRISASCIYTRGMYGTGLRTLQKAGAQVTIMTPEEFEHCWETFVDHQGTRFPRWDNIDENCQRLSMALKRILQEN